MLSHIATIDHSYMKHVGLVWSRGRTYGQRQDQPIFSISRYIIMSDSTQPSITPTLGDQRYVVSDCGDIPLGSLHMGYLRREPEARELKDGSFEVRPTSYVSNMLAMGMPAVRTRVVDSVCARRYTPLQPVDQDNVPKPMADEELLMAEARSQRDGRIARTLSHTDGLYTGEQAPVDPLVPSPAQPTPNPHPVVVEIEGVGQAQVREALARSKVASTGYSGPHPTTGLTTGPPAVTWAEERLSSYSTDQNDDDVPELVTYEEFMAEARSQRDGRIVRTVSHTTRGQPVTGIATTPPAMSWDDALMAQISATFATDAIHVRGLAVSVGDGKAVEATDVSSSPSLQERSPLDEADDGVQPQGFTASASQGHTIDVVVLPLSSDPQLEVDPEVRDHAAIASLPQDVLRTIALDLTLNQTLHFIDDFPGTLVSKDFYPGDVDTHGVPEDRAFWIEKIKRDRHGLVPPAALDNPFMYYARYTRNVGGGVDEYCYIPDDDGSGEGGHRHECRPPQLKATRIVAGGDYGIWAVTMAGLVWHRDVTDLLGQWRPVEIPLAPIGMVPVDVACDQMGHCASIIYANDARTQYGLAVIFERGQSSTPNRPTNSGYIDLDSRGIAPVVEMRATARCSDYRSLHVELLNSRGRVYGLSFNMHHNPPHHPVGANTGAAMTAGDVLELPGKRHDLLQQDLRDDIDSIECGSYRHTAPIDVYKTGRRYYLVSLTLGATPRDEDD